MNRRSGLGKSARLRRLWYRRRSREGRRRG